MKRIAVLVAAMLSMGCEEKWRKLSPGDDGVLSQPADSRLGTVLSSGKIVAAPMMDLKAGPSYDPVKPTAPLELSPGQRVRVVAENGYAAPDDRGRPIEILIVDGPHHGLHATIRRDQFTPRRGR